MDLGEVALLLAAGLAAGVINAVAGGGSLVTFPVLVATGLPPVAANVTSAVAVSPGNVASVAGSRAGLAGQRRRVWRLLVTAAAGAAAGSALLLLSPARAFEVVVPFLVLAATGLMAFQEPLRKLVGHPRVQSPARAAVSLHLVVALAGVYGAYFRPALGVVLLALLALVLDETMPRLNALKNVGQATVGVVTVVIFALFGPVEWWDVLVLVPATIAGGYGGARLAPRLPATAWRAGIVLLGLVASGYLFVRTFA